MALRIVFAGTPEFSVPCLDAAAARGEVVAVKGEPVAKAGRGRYLPKAKPDAAIPLGRSIFSEDISDIF